MDDLTPMKRSVGTFLENVAESGAACLVTMVQGNVLALGLGHWLIASQTGLFVGAAATGVLVLLRRANRLVVAALLAVVTAFVDYLVHPGQFGPIALEAAVTGAGAGVLSLVVSAWRRGGTPRDRLFRTFFA